MVAHIKILFLVFFWFGRNQYKKPVPERNVVKLFFQCSWVKLKLLQYTDFVLTNFPLACHNTAEIQDKRTALA